MIQARHLRVLRAVDQAGSITGAARTLGCTQPAVSQQIKALEGAVRTPLLVRTGRGVRLTEAGEILARYAADILSRLAAAEEEVASIVGARSARVRLSSFLSGASEILPPALSALRDKWPGIEVSFTDTAPPRSVEMLRNGECEIALAFHYPDSDGSGTVPEWEGLVVHHLMTDRLLLLAPPGHRHTDTEHISLAELADETWVAGCTSCRHHLVELCEAEGFSPRIDLATDDHLAVVALVAAGLGMAILPELALNTWAESVQVLHLEPPAHREIVALTLPETEFAPAVRAMIEELRAAAQSFRRQLRSPAAQETDPHIWTARK